MPNVDYSLNNELDKASHEQLDGQQTEMFFTRLLSARRYVDELFQNNYELPAYPCLDILLIGRNTGDRLNTDYVAEKLSLTHTVASRYIDIMLTKGLLEQNDVSYELSFIGKKILTDIVRNNLSNAFSLVD